MVFFNNIMKQEYLFNCNPLTYQPSGQCDFSKIYNPKTAFLMITNMVTFEKQEYVLVRKDVNIKKGTHKGTKYIYSIVK